MKRNWTEYAFEAWGLGLFMLSACGFSIILFHPSSPVVAALPSPWARRGIMGLAMALTGVLNNYAPWGKRSGAHLNPAVTLSFYGLGKVAPGDLVGYLVGQFLGAVLGTAAAAGLFGADLADPSVNYAATVPGPGGVALAFAAEFAMTFVLMAAVLAALRRPALARWTGIVGPLLVALYITIEAPISGMSLNPARSVGSAVFARTWDAIWIYWVAPVLGMGAAAVVSVRVAGAAHCAKMVHDGVSRCLFCEWNARAGNPRH